MALVHSSNCKPVIIPVNGNNERAEIDRLQGMDFSVATNREKVQEIGRDGAVGYRKNIPTISGTLTQLEYGSFDFWNQITNKPENNDKIDLNDFKTSLYDVVGYKTDDDNNFVGSVWYPKLRTSGFSLNIGDQSANAERSFSVVGEDEILWQNDNKYVISLTDTSCTTTTHTIKLGAGAWSAYPAPVKDPDTSNTYILRVVRVRSGESVELLEGIDFDYDSGTKTIDFAGPAGASSVSGDVYKVVYTASTYISGVDPFVLNDTDMVSLPAENCSIYLSDGVYIHKLQSVSIEVSFERNDLKEIGNSEVISRGIKSKTVSVTLGRTLESYTMEEILRGKAGDSWGKIDPREFSDNNKLVVKMYDDKDKKTFKLGFSSSDLAALSMDDGQAVDDYGTRTINMSGETLVITKNESKL